jgi:hypothetical protein
MHPRSFTLLEVVLIVLIVSLLLALLAPGLGRARERGYEVRDLASLSGNAGVLALYSNDWKESFPAFASPEGAAAVLYFHGGTQFEVVPRYFLSSSFWNFALAEQYFGGEPRVASAYPAEMAAKNGGPGGEPFLLTCTVFADPNYWNLSKRVGAGQLGATTQSMVAFPSSKILLSSGWAWRRFQTGVAPALDDPGIRVPVARADGSAAVVRGADIAPGVGSGDGPDVLRSIHFNERPPGSHTIDGLAGRDLK